MAGRPGAPNALYMLGREALDRSVVVNLHVLHKAS